MKHYIQRLTFMMRGSALPAVLPAMWPVVLVSALSACGKTETVTVCTTDVVETGDTSAEDTSLAPDTGPADDTKVPGDTAETAGEIVSVTVPDVQSEDTSVLPECPWESWDDGLVGGRVDLVAFDPRVPGVVWATSGGALVRSLDSGATWEPSSTDVGPSRLAFPPDDTKELVASGNNGLWVSNDVGKTFEPLALSGLQVASLLAHPAAPQRVFVGTRGGGILRSDDGGKGFYPVNVGVPRMYVDALAAPYDNADVVLATGVLQTDAYGVAATGVILRSADGGRTWTTVVDQIPWGYDLSVCPSDPSRMLAAVRRGALESRDAGLTWAPIPLLGTRDVLSIAWSAERCDAFWVSVYQQGVFRIDDDGLTLTGPLEDGIDFELERFAGQLAAHPTDPDILLVATHAGLYRSADGGYHWSAVDAAKGLSIFDLDASGHRAWMATWGNRLWTRTPDSPWEKVASVPRDLVGTVAPDPTDPDRALVGSNFDAWFTSTGPAGFAVAPGVKNPLDALMLHDPDEVLVATQVSGVLRASDPGGTWSPSNTGLVPFETANGTFIDARMLVADPNRAGRVYLALYGRGVAVSDDRGVTWTQPANTLADKAVLRLAAAPNNGTTRLFALVVGAGIWVSDDGAATWTTDNDGLSSLSLNDLAVDVVTGKAYVTEGGGPIFVSDDGLAWRSLDRWCLPDNGWGPLAIVQDGGERWLIAATSANRVIRHKL